MRVLVVGAGATGGVLGARLVRAGVDVTFLVRERRRQHLDDDGLVVVDAHGATAVPVTAVTSADLTGTFDVVVLAVKEPSLDDALDGIDDVLAPDGVVVPLLNGTDHLDRLRARFGDRLLGGVMRVVATLDRAGRVVHLEPGVSVLLGELPGGASARAQRVADLLTVDGLRVTAVDDIVGRMWGKWSFIVAAGVVTCLLRNNVGNIVAVPGGADAVLGAITEAEAVVAAAGHPVGSDAHHGAVRMLTAEGSTFTSSLYRDVVAGRAGETEHLLGAFQARARELDVATPQLDLALVQLRAAALAA